MRVVALRPGAVPLVLLALTVLLATGSGRALAGRLGLADMSESQKTLAGATLGRLRLRASRPDGGRGLVAQVVRRGGFVDAQGAKRAQEGLIFTAGNPGAPEAPPAFQTSPFLALRFQPPSRRREYTL